MLATSSWLGVAIALLIALRLASFVHNTGELRSLTSVVAHTGRCERHHAEHRGFEDFAVFEGGDLVSFASDHQHFAFKFGVSMRQMLSDKMERPEAHARILRASGAQKWRQLALHNVPADFHPHGLAAWGKIGSAGSIMAVVNHRSTHDTIEIFSMRHSTAKHVRSIAHPLLFNVNDCTIASASLLFCTNWRSYVTGTIMDAIELYGQQPWSTVVACDISLKTEPLSCEIAARCATPSHCMIASA